MDDTERLALSRLKRLEPVDLANCMLYPDNRHMRTLIETLRNFGVSGHMDHKRLGVDFHRVLDNWLQDPISKPIANEEHL